MAYMHIENLYRSTLVLMTGPTLYALEKIHGTSAHVVVRSDKPPTFFAGGSSHEAFVALFADLPALVQSGDRKMTIYGEAYGGKLQGMSEVYGKELRFIAFDVFEEIDTHDGLGSTKRWLSVPEAAAFVDMMGLEFVPWREGPSTLEWVDAMRDQESEVAIRRGTGLGKWREGIVLRPIHEALDSRGNRVMAKHKRPEFRETKTPRVVDADRLQVLQDAKAIAEEYVTEERLRHVLDKLFPNDAQPQIEDTGTVIRAMIADVEREAEGEIVVTPDSKKAIGQAAAYLFKKQVTKVLA